ncbi:MAG TPA: LysM peptidoglycan-binding domain-containing protein [Chitinophagales bacterium]|nr:LysM peptidoglycan-binding domain-containing protein [Chitinophagales bacterium]
MKIALIITLLVVSSALKAQTVDFPTAAVQRFDTHVVSQGETLYSISKRYHITIDALLKLNPEIINNNLQQGKVIKVPVVQHEILKTSDDLNKEKGPAIIHKVEKGETVYSISKQYKTDVITILKWNNMKEAGIQVGQNLVVGYQSPSVRVIIGPMPTVDSSDSIISANSGVSSEVLEKEGEIKGDNKILTSLPVKDGNPDFLTKTTAVKTNDVKHDERGIAVQTHSSYDEGYFYALHATAPQGTIITVRNLMNNKIVTVKVIGRLPSTSDNENVIIKLSESAAKKLDVLDEKFLVEINYMAPGESIGGIN